MSIARSAGACPPRFFARPSGPLSVGGDRPILTCCDGAIATYSGARPQFCSAGSPDPARFRRTSPQTCSAGSPDPALLRSGDRNLQT